MSATMNAAGKNGVGSVTEMDLFDGFVDDKVFLITAGAAQIQKNVSAVVVTGVQGGAGALAKGGGDGPGVVGIAGINSVDLSTDNLDPFTQGWQCGVVGLSGDPAAVGPAPTVVCGVYGQSRDTPNPPPVGLPSGGHGVHGLAETGIGVYGEATKSILPPDGVPDETTGIGVKGVGMSAGVFGQGNAAADGVRGVGRIGVVGLSPTNTGPGVVGRTNIPKSDSQERFAIPLPRAHYGVAGLVGSLDPKSNRPGDIDPEAVGVYGAAAATLAGDKKPIGFAGLFDGPVTVNGPLTVIGGGKSAAVPHPDGSHRLLYSVESPESWFEDFGEGDLVAGKADVTLDPDFAAVVRTGTYHVFLTPYGDSNGLYVTRRSETGFVVREQRSGASNLRFSYRVVAKRKDIAGERLAKVTPRTAVARSAKPVKARRVKAKT